MNYIAARLSPLLKAECNNSGGDVFRFLNAMLKQVVAAPGHDCNGATAHDPCAGFDK